MGNATAPSVGSAAAPASRARLHWIAYGLLLALVAALWAMYGANLVRWPASPDFGWRTMYTSGPNVVAQVFGAGEAAGLLPGDRIVAVNGRAYGTFNELFFGDLRNAAPGSTNTYTVSRDGQTLEIAVPTGRLGAAKVLTRSGPLFVVGAIYILIGALVFLMKPATRESWLFLGMTCALGIGIGLSSPADLIRPAWLYDIRSAANLLIPAFMIHLALVFPKARAFASRRPWLLALPYAASVAIFALREALSAEHWTVPRLVFLLWIAYTVAGVLFFLGSMGWNALREHSVVTRLQSRVIFVGAALGLLIPALDLFAGTAWQAAIFPDPVVALGVFFTLFPLSIGYTIVKHDLFAIDVIVRRTYGYVLSTAAIVAAYAGLVSFANVAFGAAAARSPAFAIGFALVVVFFFEPMHRRIQAFVDRTFYRQSYDYRTAIRGLSEAMTSILDAERILRTLAGAVVREMVLENGVLLLPASEGGYEVAVAEGIDPRALPPRLHEHDALARLVRETKSHVLGHDVALNPAHAPGRAALERTLGALSAELVMPMLYKNELRGILSLGRKKSGKLFTPEDFDLLRTMLNQSAIALENARLFRENLEKGRMEEELKVAHDIQMGMLPEQAPQLAGLDIAARTLPAREVGGDFYDFVEFGGARLGLIIADVSGKGVSAGLLMAGARSTYRVLLDEEPPVAAVMNVANQRLHRDIRKGMFVALAYAVIDPAARTLTLSNAGQTQPILCAPGAAPCHVETEGDTFPLGIVPDCEYRDTRLALAPGATVLFYTDGVVEAMNAADELYGFERLFAALEAHRGLGVAALLDELFADIARFAGGREQHDDITIIAARLAGPQEAREPVTAQSKFELHLPSALGAERKAIAFAAEVAAKIGLPAERIEDLKSAVAEACINAIEHGNQLHASTRVGVRLTVAPDRLQVSVHDRGAGVPRVPTPDIAAQVEGGAPAGGWGIYLIENLVDEVSFESTDEGGVVKMIIYLDRPE
jgi:serine phosphatase RsbU (regulator of sigma subunit)/anti-sigma regulatory factor (Ser/Thr protein kinase)